MVAFDENELIAKRKYVFICDERPKQLFVEPWEGVDFDCKMVLPRKVLDEPYANENARRIAILKQVGADTRKDTGEVGADNEVYRDMRYDYRPGDRYGDGEAGRFAGACRPAH